MTASEYVNQRAARGVGFLCGADISGMIANMREQQ